MKLLLLLMLAFAVTGAAATAPTNAPPHTNGLAIVCDGGFVASNTPPVIIFRQNVRVLDYGSGVYLECDVLTATFQTNVTKQARTNRTPELAPPTVTGQGTNSRLDTITAEGHVLIITRDQQVVGDLAVYTATNDLFVITGEMVILATDQGIGLGQRAFFDRTRGVARGDGPFAFYGLSKDGGGMEDFLRDRASKNKTNTPSTKPKPPGTK